MAIVIEQRAIDIQKITDLKETVRSNSSMAVWIIDGEQFIHKKGDMHIKSQTSAGSPWEIWPLTGNTKTKAKAKVFSLIS